MPDTPSQAIARESGMHFGGAMFFTDYSMSAAELACARKERGFESVWAPQYAVWSTAPTDGCRLSRALARRPVAN